MVQKWYTSVILRLFALDVVKYSGLPKRCYLRNLLGRRLCTHQPVYCRKQSLWLQTVWFYMVFTQRPGKPSGTANAGWSKVRTGLTHAKSLEDFVKEPKYSQILAWNKIACLVIYVPYSVDETMYSTLFFWYPVTLLKSWKYTFITRLWGNREHFSALKVYLSKAFERNQFVCLLRFVMCWSSFVRIMFFYSEPLTFQMKTGLADSRAMLKSHITRSLNGPRYNGSHRF